MATEAAVAGGSAAADVFESHYGDDDDEDDEDEDDEDDEDFDRQANEVDSDDDDEDDDDEESAPALGRGGAAPVLVGSVVTAMRRPLDAPSGVLGASRLALTRASSRTRGRAKARAKVRPSRIAVEISSAMTR